MVSRWVAAVASWGSKRRDQELSVAAGVREWMLWIADEVGSAEGIPPRLALGGDLGELSVTWHRSDGEEVRLAVGNDVYFDHGHATVEIGYGDPVISAFLVIDDGVVGAILTDGEMVLPRDPGFVERFVAQTRLDEGGGTSHQ